MSDRRKKKMQKGITILLVMLILSIVATVALGVAFLILRQFQQGVDVKKSVQAQNAADSGVERILYRAKLARAKTTTQEDFINTPAVPGSLIGDFDCEDSAKLQSIGAVSTFCIDKGDTTRSEGSVSGTISQNQTLTFDVYDADDPEAVEVKAIRLRGVTDEPTWLEVTWVAWDTAGGALSFKSSTTKTFFSGSDINSVSGKIVSFVKSENFDYSGKSVSVYFLNSPLGQGNCSSLQDATMTTEITNEECICRSNTAPGTDACPFASSKFNFIVRVKALYGGVQSISAEACKDVACSQTTSVASRVSAKIVGETSGIKQSVRVSIPWTLPLAGLYDYAILTESTLQKNVTINPGFFSTGTIEAERDLVTADFPVQYAWQNSAYPTSTDAPNTPFQCLGGTNCSGDGWNVTAATNARCQLEPGLGASGGATCGFDGSGSSMTYSIDNLGISPTPKNYYLNTRTRVTAASVSERLLFRINGGGGARIIDELYDPIGRKFAENELDHLNKDGWLVCTAGLNTLSDSSAVNDTIEFYTDTANYPRLDWFNISTVAYAPVGQCHFENWGNTGEKMYQVEDVLAAGSCSGFALCDTSGTWRGKDRIGSQGSVIPFTANVICNAAPYVGQCYIKDDSPGSSPTGFTIPLRDASGNDEKLAEGDYFVSIKYGHFNLYNNSGLDNFYIDIAPFRAQTGPGTESYSMYASSVLSLSSTIYRLGVPETNRITVQAGTAVTNPAIGATTECVLPTKMHIRPGDAINVGVYNKSAAQNPDFIIDQVRISPDAFSGVPTCSLP